MTPEQTSKVCRRILKEAALIVAEEGIGALSMRHLASKLGMTGGALYRYFPSRQELILAHFGVGMSDLYERLMAGERSPDPLTALRDYAISFADFALSKGDAISFEISSRLPAKGYQLILLDYDRSRVKENGMKLNSPRI